MHQEMLPAAGLLPAGIAPATVSFEASRAQLLRYGSVSRDLKLIRPRATEPHSNLPLSEGLPSIREMARRRRLDAGSGRNWVPHLGGLRTAVIACDRKSGVSRLAGTTL